MTSIIRILYLYFIYIYNYIYIEYNRIEYIIFKTLVESIRLKLLSYVKIQFYI